MPHREESSLFLQVERTDLQEKLDMMADGYDEGSCILLGKTGTFPRTLLLPPR